jgi:hypothetical protein
MKNTFGKTKILLPQNVDLTKFSVVACDQFTSEIEYWNELEKTIGDAPSSLHITFPEAYLEICNEEEKIDSINSTMKKYTDSNIFKEFNNSLIYVERTLQNGAVRKGVMGAVDLLDYDFSKGSSSLIRATEGTVLERIPPRVKIRENAPLELPHIMLLIDDEKKAIIEDLEKSKSEETLVYSFDLVKDSGSIKGYLLENSVADLLLEKLSKLAEKDAFEQKYGVKDKGVLQYAVGDGNHSLASAKTCYENLRNSMSEQEFLNHPARYALVELVNLHDESLEFEAIHRIVFEVDVNNFVDELNKYYEISNEKSGQKFTLVENGINKDLYIKNPKSNLAVGSIQIFIDEYLSKNKGKVDYIHGEDVVQSLSKKENSIGILFDCMDKSELFKTVILDGSLPRKTFSMGHAWDKRFYLEARKIKN